jgi:hypothetical protein
MQKPTIGRVVLVRAPQLFEGWGPALVAHVWSDTCINVGGFTPNGHAFAYTSVTRHVEGHDGLGVTWKWPDREPAAAAEEATQ